MWLRTLLIVSIITLVVAIAGCLPDGNSSVQTCPSDQTFDSELDECVDDTSGSDAGTNDVGGEDTSGEDARNEDSGVEQDTGPTTDTVEEDTTTEEDTGPQCTGDDKLCGSTCIDTTSNSEHCGGCDSPCPGGEVCSSSQCHENEKIAGVLSALNEARSTPSNCGQYGDYDAVGSVSGHPLLHQAAQRHADDMAQNDFFDHTGSDGSSFSARIYDAGYPGRPVGENIAAAGTNPANIVQRWMDSDGHCRNNMNGSANEIGVGFASNPSSEWGTYWVLKLGTR